MDTGDKERVREATDLVALVGETVQLKQRGQEFWGCCPFHNEKTPSFHVSPQTGLWHCFGCGEGGDVFAYVEKRDNVSFVEALRYLADRAGIELHHFSGQAQGPRRIDLFAALEEAEKFFSQFLLKSPSEDAQAARTYLSKRGLGIDIAKVWRLGFAPGYGSLTKHLKQQGFKDDVLEAADLSVRRGNQLVDRFYNRVMFSIHNEQGRTIGFGGRVMGDAKPKYINSKDSQVWHKAKNLYGLHLAKEAIVAKKYVIVCEGYTDTIALHKAGFDMAVAVLGTALTLDHINLLSRFKPEKIIMLLDGDAAGQRAQEKAVQFVDKTPSALLSVTLPNGMDPKEFLDTFNASDLALLLENARPLLDAVLTQKLFSVDLSNPGKKVATLQELAGILAPLKESLLLEGYAEQIADYLGVSKESVLAQINKAGAGDAEVFEEPAFAQPAATVQLRTPKEKLEQSLVYVAFKNPVLLQEQQEELSALTFEHAGLKAIFQKIRELGGSVSSSRLLEEAQKVEPQATTLLAERPEGYREEKEAEFFRKVLVNHKFLDVQDQLAKMRVHISTGASKEESKMLLKQAGELQKQLMALKEELEKRENL